MGEPAMVLVVSGQLDGYFEPCGCTKGQAGGLIRRYEFVQRLHQQDWPTVLIDLGDLIGGPVAVHGGLEQSRIKLQYALKSLDLLKYNAVAVGSDDLSVGVGHAMGLFRDELGDTTKVVVANVRPAAEYETNFRRSLVINAGQVRLGVTSVIDPASLNKLSDPDKHKLLPAIQSPEQVLPRMLAELEAQSDYQVLMVQGTFELAQGLAVANPGFDVVVAASDSIAARSRRPDILNGGKTALVTVGKRGQHLGVFAFYKAGLTRLPSYHLVALNDLYDGPGTPIKALIRDEYRAALKAAGVVEKFPNRALAGGSPGAVYVGAATCGRCHSGTFQKWSTTRHAGAFASLIRDPKPNTAFDAECVTCHTTGFPFTSGWRSEVATPHLAGNQCENCHGPASRHVAEPDNSTFRQPLKRNTQPARDTLCIGCHDRDNSVDFEFTRYWSQIVHNGLDDYKDPKVHRGVRPE